MRKSTHTAGYAALRNQLGAMRSRAGLSQRQLALRIGVPHSWVAKIEAGERRIDLIEFGWFCEGCGIDPAKAASALFRQGGPRRKGASR